VTPIVTFPQPTITPPSLSESALEKSKQIVGPDGKPVTLKARNDDTLSISDFAKILSEALIKLREELNLAQRTDPTYLRNFYLNIITARFTSTLFDLLALQTGGWSALVTNETNIIDFANTNLADFQQIIDATAAEDQNNLNKFSILKDVYNQTVFPASPDAKAAVLDVFNNPVGEPLAIDNHNNDVIALNDQLTGFDAALNNVYAQDQVQQDALNAQLTLYNDADFNSMTQEQIDQLVQQTNDAINAYNTYVYTRNQDIGTLFDNLRASIVSYNGTVGTTNEVYDAINRLRTAFGLAETYAPVTGLDPTPIQTDPQNPMGLSALSPVSASSQPVTLAEPAGKPLNSASDFLKTPTVLLPGQGQTYSFGQYNDYAALRNALLDTAYANFGVVAGAYNQINGIYNTAVEIVNPIRAQYNLNPPYPENIPSLPTRPVEYGNLDLIPLATGQPINQVTIQPPSGSALDYVNFPNPVTLYPNEDDILSQALVDMTLQSLGVIALMNTIVEGIKGEIARQLFFNPGQNIVLPDAFIQKQPDVFLQSGGAQGFGLGSFAVPVFAPAMERILARGIFETAAKEFAIPLPPRAFDAIQLATLQAVSQTALLSITPTTRLFGNRLAGLAANNPGLAVAVGLSYTNQVLQAITSGSVFSLVNRTIQNFVRQARLAARAGILPPGLELLATGSVGQIAELSRAIAAGASFALLGIGLTKLAQAINLPTLSLDLFKSLEGPGLANAIRQAIGGGVQLRDILQNPLSVLFLKAQLADFLINQRGFLSSSAAQIVGSSIDDVLQVGLLNNFFQLQESLRLALKLQGVSPLVAAKASSEAVSYLRLELGLNPALANSAYQSQFDQQAAVREIILTGIAKDRVNVGTIIQESLQRTIRQGGYETQREFRNAIVNELRSQGFRTTDASFIANQVINFAAGAPLSPLSGISTSQLSLIQGNFSSSAIAQALGRGPFSSEAEFLAILRGTSGLSNTAFNQATSPLSGSPHSLEDLIGGVKTAVLKTLSGKTDQNFAGTLANSVAFTLFGALSQKEVTNVEGHNPLSVTNQMKDLISTLQSKENQSLATQVSLYFRDLSEANGNFIETLNKVFRPPETAIVNQASALSGGNRELQFLGGV
jgi:hypothetical protein